MKSGFLTQNICRFTLDAVSQYILIKIRYLSLIYFKNLFEEVMIGTKYVL